MAEHVVDALEAVEIDEEQADKVALALSLCERVRQAVHALH